MTTTGQMPFMSPRRKFALWVAGIVLLGSVVAVTLVTLSFDPNAYKNEISTWVKTNTGRELQIDGKIELSFLPWLGVKLNHIQVSNAPGFGATPLLRAGLAQLRVKLIPLLQGQWVTGVVVLEGAALHLSRDASGRGNWEPLTHGEAPRANLAAFSVGGLSITDTSLIWDDLQHDQHVTLEKLTLHTGAIAAREPFNLKLGFDTALSPQLSGHFEASGKGIIDLDAQHYQLREAFIQARIKGEPLPQKDLSLQINTDISVNINQQILSLNNLKIESTGITLQGHLQAAPVSSAARLTGRLQVTPFSPRAVLRKLDIALPAGFPAASLQQAALSTELSGSLDEVHLTKLTLQLDDTAGSGEIILRMKQKPLLNIDLTFDQFDLGRYIAPTQGQPAALPIETLRALPVQGSVRVAKLKFGEMQADDATLIIGTPP